VYCAHRPGNRRARPARRANAGWVLPWQTRRSRSLSPSPYLPARLRSPTHPHQSNLPLHLPSLAPPRLPRLLRRRPLVASAPRSRRHRAPLARSSGSRRGCPAFRPGRKRRLTSPEMSALFASIFACLGSGCTPAPLRKRCCGTTARTPGTCGTWPLSSTSTGIRAGRPRRATRSSAASSPRHGPSTRGWRQAPRRCSSRRCGTSPRRWPPSSTRTTRHGDHRGARPGGTRGSGSWGGAGGTGTCAVCLATSDRSGCRRPGGCGSAGRARCRRA